VGKEYGGMEEDEKVEDMTWEHEVVILEKNVRDLQKQLNQAHKRIATLVDQNTSKNVSLKAVGKIVEEELKYEKPVYDQVPLKDIKEIVSL
jgi:hypothetical protein|tara:strand:- start:369 stop:641 length:273 start_codon:yes stop_codon:yes gene_type:complete